MSTVPRTRRSTHDQHNPVTDAFRPPAGQLALFPAPHTSPARFDTGPSDAGGAGSRVDGVDHAVTPVGALEAVPDALDDRPVAEGAEPPAECPHDHVDAPAIPTPGGAL